MALIIPIILGLSGVAYIAVQGVGPLAVKEGQSPHCTTTVPTGGNIQTAINAASPGSVICISPGTYPQQLTISTSLTLMGLGTTRNPSEIQPTSVVSNSNDPDSGSPEANIILVSGVSSRAGVTINNLVVDGSLASSSFTGCGVDYEGILYLNANGVVTDTTVQNIYLPVALAGCQPGDAIEVQTAAGHSSSVTISNDQALNYNKNGITCNDAGTTCTITGNTVSFYSAYAPYIAPNGIQIAYGAVASVSQNTVSGNECNLATACGPNLATQAQGIGILTYQSGAGTVLQGNTVTGNDIGVATAADTATATGNTIQNNRDIGLLLNDGTYKPTNNKISGGQVAIAVLSDGLVASPTNVNLVNNNLVRTFPTAYVQVVTFIGGSNGGPNAEPVNLQVDGSTYSISGGTSTNPTIVNITNMP